LKHYPSVVELAFLLCLAGFQESGCNQFCGMLGSLNSVSWEKIGQEKGIRKW
jgi:hypothetical protein